MKTLRLAAIGLLIIGASAFGWRVMRARLHPQTSATSAQPSAIRTVDSKPQNPSPQVSSTVPLASGSPKRLGPFSIAGRDYTVELEMKKVTPGSSDEDTVVAMEIRDVDGMVQYRRTFPYVEGTEDDYSGWSISALLLVGTNVTGLLVSYDSYSEPSAPEEEPTGWFQIFGVVNGKFVPFDAPLEVQGGLLDEYVEGHTYKAARPLGAEADAVEFKVWTGHCRMIFPVRVNWAQGRLAPAEECVKAARDLGGGCQYRLVPEDKLYSQGITFVRLWPNPDEKSGQPVKTVVKTDSKVELLTARVATHWAEGNPAGPTADSKGPMDDAGSFGVTSDGVPDSDTDLWLKVRIDTKEGWMHSEEDFRALGLPEDE